MSNFEDKIYDYFTQRSNFRAAFEIAERFLEIRSKLLSDFWHLVYVDLLHLCHNSCFKATLKYERDSLDIYSSDWGNNLAVYFHGLEEEPILRIWIEHKGFYFNKEAVLDYINRNEDFKVLEKKDYNWTLGGRKIGDNFNHISSLEKLLPDAVKDTAAIYAKALYDFALTFDLHLQNIKKMRG